MSCYGNNNDGDNAVYKKVVCKFKKNKNLSQTRQISQKGNQDL